MLDPYLETVQRQRKQFTVYTAGERADITDQLSVRNVTVEEKHGLPHSTPSFVTIHEDETFVGALRLDDLQMLLMPPIFRPGAWDGLAAGYRAILSVLEETVFTALNRRQLLATSREIEDRAFRVGAGTLHVTFQSFSVFTSQIELYQFLSEETGLDIHVHGVPDRTLPAIENITYHADETGALAPFWCLAFDGGPDDTQACVLIARQKTDQYLGFWSYDKALVDDVQATLDAH